MGDLVLAGFAAVLAFRNPDPMNGWQLLACFAAVVSGSWLCVLPFLREHQASVKLGEAAALADSVTRMDRLDEVQTQIATATDQWQLVQNHSNQTVAAAKEIADRMKAQLSDFCAFMQKAQDSEKNHLKLEVEKLRRAEREWLQAAVLILDHVFALHAAAARTGQPSVVAQLDQFQFACREAVRRVGLSGFVPAVHDAFNPQAHQIENGGASPEEAARVLEVLALGYTYQGELVRRALVKVESERERAAASETEAQASLFDSPESPAPAA